MRKPPGKPPSRRRNRRGGWREKIQTSTRMIIHGLRSTRGPSDPTIRTDVIRAAREALGIAPASSMRTTVEGAESGREVALNAAGVFRLVIVNEKLAYQDAMMAESIMEEIQATLDAELA